MPLLARWITLFLFGCPFLEGFPFSLGYFHMGIWSVLGLALQACIVIVDIGLAFKL